MIWENDYSNQPIAPGPTTRIMFLIAAIFGVSIVLAAMLAPFSEALWR